jgi:hypothetical protein
MAKSFDELALLSVPDLCRAHSVDSARFEPMAQAAAECLTQFGLVKSNLAERFSQNPASFEILLGDLTQPGLAFAKAGFQRWLMAVDRWKLGGDVQKYKSALTKQWEKHRDNAV